jgi:hypothetical protein
MKAGPPGKGHIGKMRLDVKRKPTIFAPTLKKAGEPAKREHMLNKI